MFILIQENSEPWDVDSVWRWSVYMWLNDNRRFVSFLWSVSPDSVLFLDLCEFYEIHAKHSEVSHDDVIKWKYFPRYWPFVRGIHRSPVNSCTKAGDAELWWVFDLRPKKLLSKQSWGWWFETPSHPLWRHRNASSSWAFHWHHMSAMTAHITGKSNVCSSAWSGRQRRNH